MRESTTYGLRDAEEREDGERHALHSFVGPIEVVGERIVVSLGGDQAEDDQGHHRGEHHEVADGPDDPGRELPAQLGDEERRDAEGDGAEEQADGAHADAGVVGIHLAGAPLRHAVVDLPTHPVRVVLEEGEPRELHTRH
jgi:hypothetical protein